MSLSNLQVGPAWPTEPASGRGRSHGTSSREPFDRWFRYPAGFASDYVELLLDRLGLTEGMVIDCFAGSGVTGTAAGARGLSFAGIEAHPFVAELARLKLTPTATAAQIRTLAREVATSARKSVLSALTAVDSEPDLIRRSFADDDSVRSTRGALPVLPPVGFPGPPPAPGVHLSAHRALHKPRGVCGPAVQLGLDLQYPDPGPRQGRFRFAGIHQRNS